MGKTAEKKEMVLQTDKEAPKCFVIMPIGELPTYPTDHFKHVYEDIFKPAIEAAGYKPVRADDNKASTMIQADIIKEIVEAPMAICDLSSRNPNVLFELGIRQAFDLPVVLVQEENTPRIFDISSIRTIDYKKEMTYREVLEDRKAIIEAIIGTADGSRGINSIIRYLELPRAELDKKGSLSSQEEMMLLLHSILNEVRVDNRTKRERSIETESRNQEALFSPEYIMKIIDIGNIEKDATRAVAEKDIRKAERVIKQIDELGMRYKLGLEDIARLSAIKNKLTVMIQKKEEGFQEG